MAEKDFEADDLELKDYGFEPETYTVNNVQITDYTGIEHDKIFLVNKKDVLTKPRPSWIPELDENCLEREDFLPHCVKDSDGYYFVQKTSLDVPEDYNGPKLSDYEKRQKFTKKTYYKMSLDLIAATCDYYIKKRRAEIKLSGDTHRVGFPRSAGSMTWARYDDMVSMFSLCEAYKDDPEITKNYGHIKARRSNPKHKGYIRQTEIAFHDHYGPLLQELKDKKLDMNLQKQDAADTHKKGEETSYGMSGRSDTLKEDYGVTIKKQNGTSFDSQQLKNISEALENVWNHYGKLDDVAIAFNLGISYAANTLQHARKAVGIFHPEYHAIGVSFFEEKVADSKDSSMVLCHEVAHWLDFEKGNRDHFHYASDKTGTLENKIALKFKELVRKRNSGGKKLGDYWYRTCECLARAMEEDYGLKHDCYDFYNDQAYLTPEVFKKEIAPLVEQLLEENRKYFNLVKKENLSKELSTAKDLSFFDVNENALRKLIKSYTSSVALLKETEKSKPDTFNYLRGANKAMDNKINRYQEKIVKLQTKVDVLNMLVHLETKQVFGQFEMKTLEADICLVDRDDILRMNKNSFEYYAAVINSALKNAGFSEKKSIPLVLKNPGGYTFNTLNILEDGNIEIVSGSVNSLSEDEFKSIEEKNLELQKKIFDEVRNQPEKKAFSSRNKKKVLSSLSSDDSFVSDFRSGKFNSIFDRLSDLNFKDDFISSGSLYSKSRIEGINNLWLELFKDGVPPAVIKFENEWEKKIEDGNFNAPSFREKWIEEASKAENEKLLSYFSKMSVPDENLISEHNGHLFRTMIINAIAKQSRFLTEHTDPFSNIVLYQKPECLLEKKLRYEIIENEIKKRGLKIMQDKEIENNKETSEKKIRWFSVHYKQIAEDRAEFLNHIHKNQEIENLDIHKTLLENHLEIQGCILGGTGMIDSAYESFVCSGADGFKYLLTPHNSNHYKTENKIIVSDKIFDTFEDAVKACIEEEIKVYKPEITDYKIAEDSGYFFRMPEKYRDFILDYILENKKDIVTEAEEYAAENNISEKSQKEKLRYYIGISMEGYNKYRFDNPEWSKIIDDYVKQIENPLLYQNEKTDPEAAEKKAGKTKYKVNDQKYISKFLDKDGITIDFERWTKNDNPTKILGYNYELSLKFPITKNYLDCFARFVIDETEPDGTFIKNHIDFTAEEYINSISSYYNERNEHYPDQDEFDAIRWKYITDGQKLVRLGFTKIRDIDSDITDALIKTGRENFKDELGFYKNSSRENCRVFKLDGNAGNPLYIIHNFETQQYGVMQDVNPENPGATYFHAEGFPELDGLLLHLGERTNLSAEEEIQNIISTDNIHLNNEHGENGWHSMDMFVADEKYIKASAISDERFAMPVASWKDGEPEITVSMVSLLISDPENHDKEYLDVSSEGKPSISSDEKWNLIREQKTFDILGEQIKNLSHKGISNEETDKLFEKAKAIFMENSIDVNNFNIDKMSNSYVELFRDNVTGKLITEELNQMGFVKDPDGNYVLDDIKVSLSLVFNNKENPALIISHISDPAVMQTIHLNDSYAKKHSLGMSFKDLLESGWLKETKNPNLKSFIDGNMLERDFIGKYIPDADNNKAVTLLDDITAYEEGFSDVLKSFKDFKDAWDIPVSSEQEVFEFGGKLQKALYNAAEAIKDKKAYADSLLRYAEKYKPGMEDPDNVYGKFQFHEDELKVFLKVNMINASIYNISMDKNRDGAQIIFALMSSKDKRHYGYITADFDDPANCKYNFTDLKDHNLDISLTENISRMRDFCEKGKPFYEASEKHSVNIELTPDGSKLSFTFNEVPDIDLRSSLNWAGFKYSTIAKAWKADFNQENSDKLLATVKKYWPDDYEHAAKQMEGIGTKPAAEHKKESISVDFSQIENTSEKLAENIKFINEKYPEYKGNLTHILTDIMFNATSKNRNEILDKFRDCNNKDELNSKLKKMVYGSFETEIKKQQNVKPKKEPEEGFSR